MFKDFWVAVKRVRLRETTGVKYGDCRAELDMLKVLKECSTRNENIQCSYTEFIHGTDFVTISPLAEMDLHTFCNGDYEDFGLRRQRFTPLALVQETSCLAGALHFLHFGLWVGGKKFSCAHFNLKPENILVNWLPSNGRVVGRWKIHGFGIAMIQEAKEQVRSIGEVDFLPGFSLTSALRPPGPFQAPEVQPIDENIVGRESDVWSFGCVLAIVLAFAVGGPKYVSQLAKSLDNGRDDYCYTFDNERAVLKPSLIAWLQTLQTNSPDEHWIGRALDIIFKILVVMPGQRLKAEEVQHALDYICTDEVTSMRHRCGWVLTETSFTTKPPSHAAEGPDLLHLVVGEQTRVIAPGASESPPRITMSLPLPHPDIKGVEQTPMADPRLQNYQLLERLQIRYL
jgi:serine/threonine protein kinase